MGAATRHGSLYTTPPGGVRDGARNRSQKGSMGRYMCTYAINIIRRRRRMCVYMYIYSEARNSWKQI